MDVYILLRMEIAFWDNHDSLQQLQGFLAAQNDQACLSHVRELVAIALKRLVLAIYSIKIDQQQVTGKPQHGLHPSQSRLQTPSGSPAARPRERAGSATGGGIAGAGKAEEESALDSQMSRFESALEIAMRKEHTALVADGQAFLDGFFANFETEVLPRLMKLYPVNPRVLRMAMYFINKRCTIQKMQLLAHIRAYGMRKLRELCELSSKQQRKALADSALAPASLPSAPSPATPATPALRTPPPATSFIGTRQGHGEGITPPPSSIELITRGSLLDATAALHMELHGHIAALFPLLLLKTPNTQIQVEVDVKTDEVEVETARTGDGDDGGDGDATDARDRSMHSTSFKLDIPSLTFPSGAFSFKSARFSAAHDPHLHSYSAACPHSVSHEQTIAVDRFVSFRNDVVAALTTAQAMCTCLVRFAATHFYQHQHQPLYSGGINRSGMAGREESCSDDHGGSSCMPLPTPPSAALQSLQPPQLQPFLQQQQARVAPITGVDLLRAVYEYWRRAVRDFQLFMHALLSSLAETLFTPPGPRCTHQTLTQAQASVECTGEASSGREVAVLFQDDARLSDGAREMKLSDACDTANVVSCGSVTGSSGRGSNDTGGQIKWSNERVGKLKIDLAKFATATLPYLLYLDQYCVADRVANSGLADSPDSASHAEVSPVDVSSDSGTSPADDAAFLVTVGSAARNARADNQRSPSSANRAILVPNEAITSCSVPVSSFDTSKPSNLVGEMVRLKLLQLDTLARILIMSASRPKTLSYYEHCKGLTGFRSDAAPAALQLIARVLLGYVLPRIIIPQLTPAEERDAAAGQPMWDVVAQALKESCDRSVTQQGSSAASVGKTLSADENASSAEGAQKWYEDARVLLLLKSDVSTALADAVTALQRQCTSVQPYTLKK